MTQRTVKVGIFTEKKIEMTLTGEYMLDGEPITGIVCLEARHVKSQLHFVPTEASCSVEVKDVTIGVKFHWERKETQRFKGEMLVVPSGDALTLINILPVDDYLESVISSEMSAMSQIELLKAHAVISRSWALSLIDRKNREDKSCKCDDSHDGCLIRWYGHDDHDIFDVCADDHCQRYQGITRQTTEAVAKAVEATRGEVLMSGGELCDTRFHKCCGGVLEEFEYCWEDEHKPYLEALRDAEDTRDFPDLRIEENARQWILSSPEAYCNTNDKEVLGQVLNGYDQETTDFYRWEVRLENAYLSDLLERKLGIDFGEIIALEPVERGKSGRLSKMKIVGTKATLTIGKELEIRRALSESHLYSSAFIAEKQADGSFCLHGAGWGHGVGLCQIGAAMMAAKGYNYKEILNHYYPGSNISHVW